MQRAKSQQRGRPCLPSHALAWRWLAVVSCLGLGACLPRERDLAKARTDSETAISGPGSAARNRPKPAAISGVTAIKAPAVAAGSDRTAANPAQASVSSGAAPAIREPASASDAALQGPFNDDFERDVVGDNWRVTSNAWHLEQGRLCVAGAHNHPIWLTKRLPTNARIEFEATSYSADGDLKAEFWGDGSSAASQASYTNATSYLTIFGGWKNHYHVLARIDEHAADRPEIVIDPRSDELRTQPVISDRTYQFRVERNDSKTVMWWVDGKEILRYTDGSPLLGVGHEHFGFNNWEVRTCFDKLRVLPLSG